VGSLVVSPGISESTNYSFEESAMANSDAAKVTVVSNAPSGESTHHSTEFAPVVVDLGKKSRKQVKQLREGRGKLLIEVNDVISELRKTDSLSSGQPVVVVVQPRRRVRDRSLLWPLV
jgi:hypothetical protein